MTLVTPPITRLEYVQQGPRMQQVSLSMLARRRHCSDRFHSDGFVSLLLLTSGYTSMLSGLDARL